MTQQGKWFGIGCPFGKSVGVGLRKEDSQVCKRQARGWHALCVLDEVGCAGFASIQAQWNQRRHRKGAITHRKCQDGLDQEA